MKSRLGLAAALSVLLHLLLGTGLVLLRPFAAAEGSPPAERIEIQLVEPSDPTFFTELPEDRADTPPDQADFLSNVDSRARDDAPGGQDALPRATGEADAPQVAISRGEPVPPSPPVPEAEPVPESAEPSEAPETEERTESGRETVLRPPEPAVTTEDRPSLREQFAAQQAARPTATGSSDILQEALRNPAGNAALEGSVSLNTTAWDFAPWIQAFRRKVEERWHAPMAWRMGLIAGDLTVRIEIARSGELLDLRVLKQDVGHSSLTDAVLYAVREGARYRALPSHFPEETLIMHYTFVYPQVRRR